MFDKLLKLFRKSQNKSSQDFDPTKVEQLLSMIEKLVGVKPKDSQYFIKAFTHRSYLETTREEIKSNERLEFLGDAVLGKIIAELLFHKYPNQDEGYLTKVRSYLVNKESLEEVGYHLKLHEYIFLNDKYLTNDKRKLGNVVADTVEAFIAAIYLDMGEAKVNAFINRNIVTHLSKNGLLDYDKNFKGQLLEYSHAQKLQTPSYTIVEQIGPQHDKTFKIRVNVGEEYFGEGEGPNKKTAEQEAALNTLKMIGVLS
ncbi:MAG: ribonuclease III [Ignavibacteriae bacterium]|nr:ribonuclease III [Ignavibacteriota bacterium]